MKSAQFMSLAVLLFTLGCNDRSKTIRGEERSAAQMFAGVWIGWVHPDPGNTYNRRWWIFPDKGLIIDTTVPTSDSINGQEISRKRLGFDVVSESTDDHQNKILLLRLHQNTNPRLVVITVKFSADGKSFGLFDMAENHLGGFYYSSDTAGLNPEDLGINN